MFRKKIRRIFSIILVAGISVSLLSACEKAESVSEETTISEIIVSETTAKYSDEELELMAQDMPEIVFVLSFNHNNENIYGYYVTNTGDIKIYDFRKIAPDKTYEVPDIYTKLAEACCDKLEPEIYDELFFEEYTIYENELCDLSKEQITEYYKKLLQINGNAIYNDNVVPMDYEIGNYRFWGIKKQNNQKYEFMLLYGDGADYRYDHPEPMAVEIYMEFRRFLPNHLF